MGTHDDDAGGSALAAALSGPLAAGSLEAALHAARAFFLRHPGDDGAKRVVEAIELLMAQVWFGGAEEGEPPDPLFAQAAQHLGSTELDEALACYEEASGPRASRLALCVRVLAAAASASPLPERAPVPAPPSFDDETRVAGDGELPLAAFAYDDVTANVDRAIPAEAYPEEPTRHLMIGDYEILDGPPVQVEADEDERTRILQPKQLEGLGPPPVADGTQEVTRIAGAGELPLEELRRQIAKEADSDLDAMIVTMEKEPSAPALSSPAEPSLMLDITVDDLELDRSSQPGDARGPAGPPPPVLVPASPERSAIAPEPPSQIRRAPAPGSAPVSVSRSEGALPFAAAEGSTTPEARPHRPSSPDAARVSQSAPAPGSVPAPPPAPPPAPASIDAARPDLLSAPPASIDAARPDLSAAPMSDVAAPVAAPAATTGSVPAPPPAPPPAPASINAPRPDLLASPGAATQTYKSNEEDPTVRGPAVPAPPRGPVVPPPPLAIGHAPSTPVVAQAPRAAASSSAPMPPGTAAPSPPAHAPTLPAALATPPSAPMPVGSPPAMPAPPFAGDPVHAPLDTSEVALPAEASWSIREPGAEDGAEPDPLADHSWSGVRTYDPEPAAFEPGVDPVDADTWGDDEATMAGTPSPEQRAEAHAARGELREALAIYQEEATKRPEEPQLWDRVAEIARMLQQRSS